jgi:hypothetical protein
MHFSSSLIIRAGHIGQINAFHGAVYLTKCFFFSFVFNIRVNVGMTSDYETRLI